MDYQTVLDEVGQWPIEEQLRLIQDVGDRFAECDDEPELTDELKELLDRRVASLHANPRDVISWEDIKEYVRRPR